MRGTGRNVWVCKRGKHDRGHPLDPHPPDKTTHLPELRVAPVALQHGLQLLLRQHLFRLGLGRRCGRHCRNGAAVRRVLWSMEGNSCQRAQAYGGMIAAPPCCGCGEWFMGLVGRVLCLSDRLCWLTLPARSLVVSSSVICSLFLCSSSATTSCSSLARSLEGFESKLVGEPQRINQRTQDVGTRHPSRRCLPDPVRRSPQAKTNEKKWI